MMNTATPISPGESGTLAGAFRKRVDKTPDSTAYIQFDPVGGRWQSYSWAETATCVARWQAALAGEGLKPGDRIAIMMKNCREWAILDQAALGLGLVTVPVYTNDRAENVGYILKDANARLLVIDSDQQLDALQPVRQVLDGLLRVVVVNPDIPAAIGIQRNAVTADEWLPGGDPGPLQARDSAADALATIVYTSGTTGRPKGVMLSSNNILWNAGACADVIDIFPSDLFLSFLPLSHMLERTVGYYLPILTGSAVAYARSIPQLSDDLLEIRPTIIVSVPRIFERVHRKLRETLDGRPALARRLFEKAVEVGWQDFEYRQKRGNWSPALLLRPLLGELVARKVQAGLGGRLRIAVCGGAAMSPEIASVFIGLGIPIQQGYGLTETSPVVAANSLQNNVPASVGTALQGCEIRIGENDELLVRSPGVMLGYWNNPDATKQVIDDEGWFHTGDRARIDGNHIFITGRLKEVIVMANGEKVPPGDMEMAITSDPLFDQAMVIGEGKPCLAALVVLNPAQREKLVAEMGIDPRDPAAGEKLEGALLERIGGLIREFPGYAKIRHVGVAGEHWDIDNGMMTPTLKLRRNRILEEYSTLVEGLYARR